MIILALFLTGCCVDPGSILGGDDPSASGPSSPGLEPSPRAVEGSADGLADADADAGTIRPGAIFQAEEKRGILPGTMTNRPNAPVEGITRSQCGDFTDGGPMEGPDCITGTLECGETIIGHTVGGTTDTFSTDFYRRHFCTPATTRHDTAPARVYHVRAPDEPTRMWFTLDTPCADLDLGVMRVNTASRCPRIDDNIPDCDMWPKDGTQREIVDVPSVGASDWLAVVHGKDGEEGAFALTLQCMPGIH